MEASTSEPSPNFSIITESKMRVNLCTFLNILMDEIV